MQLQERLCADLNSLQAFVALNAERLKLASHSPDLRRFAVEANVDAPVTTADGFEVVGKHRLLIDIPDAYLNRDSMGGFVKSRIRREGARVFHPNVFQSDGCFCYNSRFTPNQSLAEQLHTAIDLMQCRLINHASPANSAADAFFRRNAAGIRRQITCVDLRLPRTDVHITMRPMPRVL